MNPIAFVFALIALVGTIVAGVMFGSSLSRGATQTSTVSLLNQVASNVQSHYRTQGRFTGISTQTEIANADIPASLVASDGSSVHAPYGGTLRISGPLNLNAGTDNGFGITLSGLSQTLCSNLATSVVAYAVASGSSIHVGDPGTLNRAATEAEAAALCPNSSNNALTWTYRIGGVA